MRLLLAEDDSALADGLAVQLRRCDFAVEHVHNGAVAEYLLLRQAFDVAVIDQALPLLDGLSVLKRVRAARPALPVLMLQAEGGLAQRVAGLNAGADDVLSKPFDFSELEARLRAVLRRCLAPAASTEFGRLRLDRETHKASVAGHPLELSPREWKLLELLLSQREKVVGKEQIVAAWSSDGGQPGSGNSIEVYIHRLRCKLDGSALAIRTVRGLGYQLEAELER